MASGVKVSDDCFARFTEMKMKKKQRYLIMQIDGPYVIFKKAVEKSDDEKRDYDEFLGLLPKNECCYVVLDLKKPSQSGQGKEVLYTITWCPDSAVIKDKMLYAATRQAFLDKIKEGTKNIQANDLSDLAYEDLLVM